jgi:hypothetical protein
MAPVKLSDNLPPAPVKLSDNFTGVEKNVYLCAKNDMVRNMFQSLHSLDDILFWRTADGNEVDFVMPYLEKPYAVEIKYDKALIKPAKYKKFEETYPDIPLSFKCLQPFEEDFFRF